MPVDPSRAARIAANVAKWRHPGFPALAGEVARRMQAVAGAPTLCTPADRELLCALALQRSGGTALEVGRFAGAVTALFAVCGLEVWSIDESLYHSSMVALAPQNVAMLDAACPGWYRTADVAERVLWSRQCRAHLINGDSLNPAMWPDLLFDLAFIDGGHSERECHNDLWKCWCRLRPRGILACHDYDLHVREDPAAGVDTAFDGFIAGLWHSREHIAGPYTAEGSSIVWLVKE